MGKKHAKKSKLAKKSAASIAALDPSELTGRQKHQLKVDMKRSLRAQKKKLQEARRQIPKSSKDVDEKAQRRALLDDIRALGKDAETADDAAMDE